MTILKKSSFIGNTSPLRIDEFDSVILKIGIDVGISLIRFAQFYKNTYFIGVEIKPDKAAMAFDRVRRSGINNVDVVAMDALDLIRNFLPPGSINEVFVFFPTPYKRVLEQLGFSGSDRLISSEFEVGARKVCREFGSIRVVTDVEDYILEAEKIFSGGDWWVIPWQKMDAIKSNKVYVGTPCEIDYRSQRREIFSFQAVKI